MKPRRVAATPAALECVVTGVLHLRDAGGAETGRHLVIGQVVGVHIDDRYLANGIFDTAGASPLARCGYRVYATVTTIFQMLRPGES